MKEDKSNIYLLAIVGIVAITALTVMVTDKGTEGYQLKGTVTIETSGQRFEETAKWIDDLSAKAGFPLKSKGAVILKIEEIHGVSPGPGAGAKLV